MWRGKEAKIIQGQENRYIMNKKKTGNIKREK
jgi:hypothetical protein